MAGVGGGARPRSGADVMDSRRVAAWRVVLLPACLALVLGAGRLRRWWGGRSDSRRRTSRAPSVASPSAALPRAVPRRGETVEISLWHSESASNLDTIQRLARRFNDFSERGKSQARLPGNQRREHGQGAGLPARRRSAHHRLSGRGAGPASHRFRWLPPDAGLHRPGGLRPFGLRREDHSVLHGGRQAAGYADLHLRSRADLQQAGLQRGGTRSREAPQGPGGTERGLAEVREAGLPRQPDAHRHGPRNICLVSRGGSGRAR